MTPPGSPQRPLPGFEGIKRYWDKTHNMFVARILPGDFYVTTNKELISTVLGSCVSACIRDRIFGIGGMNHFMLPLDQGASGSWSSTGDADYSTRFGNHAMEQLINEILKNGGNRLNLEVKIFGRGRVLAQRTDVGRKNIEFAHRYIEVEGLKLLSENVGDVHPRKVIYFPLTGKVKMKKLRSMHNNTIVEREQNYMHTIEEKPEAGEIELF